MSDHFVYILECADGSLYTGYTTDVARRLAEHNAQNGAKYTRGRTPVELLYSERFDSRSAAMSREYEIKQFSRGAKERLVAGGGGSESKSENESRSKSENENPK